MSGIAQLGTIVTAGYCAGCGTRLEPNKAPGRPRKWCSERCRKRAYGDPCVDCGARTCYGAETARVPEPRCDRCKRARQREAAVSTLIFQLRQRGELVAMTSYAPTAAKEIERTR